jgi:hypothetical protein
MDSLRRPDDADQVRRLAGGFAYGSYNGIYLTGLRGLCYKARSFSLNR